MIEDPLPYLANFPIDNVWGIGHQLGAKLRAAGVHTAGQLIKKEDGWIRKKLSVTGLQTVYELRGVPCLHVEEEEVTRKSFLLSRSLRIATGQEAILKEKVAHFIARLACKLRQRKLKASYINVFMETSKKNRIRHSSYCLLKEASAYTPLLIQTALDVFDTIYDPRTLYKRVGVMVAELSSETVHQLNLYGGAKENPNLMHVLDTINDRYDRQVLHFASEGLSPGVRSMQENVTPRYTTNWEEILEIQI